MASFTDNIQALSTFTPYVQELPVEAMVKVGMQKQQQYNQGVEKIQTAIDNIAGLDIYKDADKAYLQSRINELGNNLKVFAAGDFSDFQLVNSVNGMTTQLVKDPNVQNAVSSTAVHRKNVVTMEKDKADGKLAPENEADYLKQFSAYNDSNKVGEKFSGQYTPYIDVNKKLIEVAAAVGIDEKTLQQLYQTDGQGNILRDKNGVPKWNPVMVEKHLKGKDSAKILAAFQNALTPADINQLAITGRYLKSGNTSEDLHNEIVNNYKDNLEQTEGKIQTISIELYKQQNKNDKNLDLIESLTKQKEYFENQQDSLLNSRQKDLESLSKNPDGVRASLYTNNYLSKMSQSLSSLTEEEKYSVSPLETITMDHNRFNRDLQRDRIADQHWAAEQTRADKKELYDSQKDQLEMFLKYGYGTPPPGYAGKSGVKEPINVGDDPYKYVNTVKDDYESGVAELNQKNYDLTLQYFKDVNPQKAGESEQKYELRLKKAISSYAIKNKESIDPNSGGINTFTARFAAKQIQQWKSHPQDIPYELRGLMEQQYNLNNDLNFEKNRIQEVRQEAIKEAKKQGLDFPTEQEIKKNIKEVTINVSKLGNIKLTKDDVIDYANMHPEVFNTFGGFTVDKDQELAADRAKKRQALKYGDNYKDIERKLFGIVYAPSEFGGDVSEIATNVHPIIKSTGKFILSSNYGKISKIEANLYKNKGYIKQAVSYPVQRGTENKDDVNSRIISIISKYPNNLNEVEGFNTEDMITAVSSDKGSAVKLTEHPGVSSRQPTTYTMTVFGNQGKQQTVQIDREDFTYLSKQPARENVAEPKVVRQLESHGTTSLDGTTNPNAAWFPSSSFKNLQGSGYNVTANFIEDKGDSNLLWFKMYIHNSNGTITPITYDQPINKFNTDGSYSKALDRMPEAIYPTVIQQLLKSKK